MSKTLDRQYHGAVSKVLTHFLIWKEVVSHQMILHQAIHSYQSAILISTHQKESCISTVPQTSLSSLKEMGHDLFNLVLIIMFLGKGLRSWRPTN